MGDLNSLKKAKFAKEQRGLCFFCHLRLHNDMTWEHLVAQTHGGTDRISNLRIAHSACNCLVSTLPVGVKFALSDIGRDYGSDAFFILAEELKTRANDHRFTMMHRRRPKPAPSHIHRRTVETLLSRLPLAIIGTDESDARRADSGASRDMIRLAA